MDQEYNLGRYLDIDSQIQKLIKRKISMRQEIYNRTLATHLAYDEISIHTHAPKIEFIVSDNAEAEMLIDRQIERWHIRAKYFSKFLATLSQNEAESLIKGYASKELKDAALEEIEEIETAMAFRYGWEVPQEKVELTDDLFSNIAIMAEVFG